jgi:hypothetical protein
MLLLPPEYIATALVTPSQMAFQAVQCTVHVQGETVSTCITLRNKKEVRWSQI